MIRPIRVLELRSVRGTGGGPEKTILLGAESSDSERFSVTVCYLRDQRDPIFAIDRRAQQMGIDYVEIRERHSFDPSIWRALRRLVHDREFDIVHAHDYKTNLLALLLSTAEPVVPLSTVHGWTGHTLRERICYYPVDRRVLARFPQLIAVSSEIRTTLIKAGAEPHRVKLILNGIDHRAFRRDPGREAEARAAFGIGREDVVIGAVGRLEPQKRFDLLLEAFAALRRDRPELRLLIAGDGGSRRELEATAKRLALGAACQFLGHCHDVASVHHAFDLFVQSSEYEGTPNAVLEAMALETPIVATEVGGTGELIEDTVHGLLVRPHDAAELARAIERALAERPETARRVSAARARVEHELSFEARTAAVESIYRQLVETRPRRFEPRAGMEKTS